jgi:hypothetical protein
LLWGKKRKERNERDTLNPNSVQTLNKNGDAFWRQNFSKNSLQKEIWIE